MVRSKPKGTAAKFKKAPQAPRRFKSAYMFFSSEKHKEIRLHEEQKIPTTEVAKMVSIAWKSMPAEERQKWEDLARRDKARYDLEKSLYTGPWKVPAEDRPRKDPNAPKRPMSAFLSFANGKRAMVKRQYPVASNAEISQILSRMWKVAPAEHRDPHIKRELELRLRYKDQMAEFKKNNEAEIVQARQEREEVALRTIDKMDKMNQSNPDLNPDPMRMKPFAAAPSSNFMMPQNGGQQDLGSLLWPRPFPGWNANNNNNTTPMWNLPTSAWSVPGCIPNGDSLEQTLQAAVQLEQGMCGNLPEIEPSPIYQHHSFMQSDNNQSMPAHINVTPLQFTSGTTFDDTPQIDHYQQSFQQNLEPNFALSASAPMSYSSDPFEGTLMNQDEHDFGSL